MADERGEREESVAYAREELLDSIKSDRVRARLESLEPYEAFDWGRLFPKTGGMGAARDIKRRLVMLDSIQGRLDFLLYPGEQIEFVTKGTLNSFLEQYFMGIWAFLINRTLILFTNYRVILINSDRKGRAKALMWQMPYGRLAKYGRGRMGASIAFKLDSGKAYKFAGVPKSDRKRLRHYMGERIQDARASEFQFPSHEARDSLCPTCATPVAQSHRSCSECNETFINPRTPALLSLILPGLGDLYLGHRGMAILEIIGFLYALAIIVGVAVSAGLAGVIIAIVALAFVNGYDALVTRHVAMKGKLPLRLAWKSQKST